jgi:DNA modification methylase
VRIILIKLLHGDAHDWEQWPVTSKLKVLLTDPPYVLNQAWRKKWHGNNGKSTLRDGIIPAWETQIDHQLIADLVAWADVAIIWGGNFYTLPPSPVWFVWDKLQSNRGSDAELAWTNAQIKGVKVFRMSRIDAYFNKRVFPKKHLAEKPIQLMDWCLQQLGLSSNALIFDPFMGSGSSMIAAQKLGMDGVGMDNDEQWIVETQHRLAALTTEEK